MSYVQELGGLVRIPPTTAIGQLVIPAATFDGTTDDSAAFQAVLDAGYSILVPARKTAVVKNLQFKFNHQGISGLGQSVLKVTDATADCLKIVGPFSSQIPIDTGQANGVFIDNLIILGPGTYNPTNGSFSGSTGYGIRAKNAGGTFAGDFLRVTNCQIYYFDTAFYSQGFGNGYFANLDLEKCNHGFVGGDTTGNGMVFDGLTSSFNATDCINISAGAGWVFHLRDMNADIGGTSIQIVQTGGSSAIYDGGNFEGISTTGPAVQVGGSFSVFRNCHWITGGGTDTSPIIVNGGTVYVDPSCTYGGTAKMVACNFDSKGLLGGSGMLPGVHAPDATYGGESFRLGPFPHVLDNAVDAAAAGLNGSVVIMVPRAGTNLTGTIYLYTNDGAASPTPLRINLDPAGLLAANQTVIAAWTFNASILIPALGGSLGSQSGGVYFNSKWRIGGSLQDAGDFNFIYNTNFERFYLDGTNNRAHIGFNTSNTTPTGTATVNLYGSVNLPNLPTSNPGPGQLWNNLNIVTVGS